MASYGVPRDDRDSGSRRLFDLTLFLRDAGWSVDFVAANGLGEMRHVHALRRRGVAIHDGGLLSSKAGSSPEVFAQLTAATKYDLAVLAFWPIAELYAPILRRVSPQTRIIVDSLDLHFLRDARRILGSSQSSETPALLDLDFASQMVGELNSYIAADAVMTVSPAEETLLKNIAGDSVLTGVVPDCEDMDASAIPYSERSGVLLLGSFQHLPNVDALQYLCRDVLPRVEANLLARHPVYIVGSGVNDTVRRIVQGVPHTRLVGWVPSVVPYFHRARISVLPLLYGAGTKRKFIQALMTATPTVSTSIGAEGLDLQDGEHMLVADDATSFARAIERLLSDEGLWHHIGATGRAHIRKTHGRSVVRDRFLQMAQTTLQRPPKRGPLPEGNRETYLSRITYQHNQTVTTAARKLVAEAAPADATILVASGGSQEMLKLGGSAAWHFPRSHDGSYRCDGFADGIAAVNHLESLRSEGADMLLLPSTAFWMLDHYPELKRNLDEKHRLAAKDDGVCLLYELRNGHAKQVSHARSVVQDRSPDSAAHQTSGNGSIAGAGTSVRVIAFYLPQYHPIPENDRWWGDGFTEWRNVVKAQPLFPGHHQPQLPTDLGFYDLRCPETRADQAELARRHGIHGFCYYHYWFNGKQLLERPFNEVLRTEKPDFPFCLCWANEPWSRRWDGSETDVLQRQSYSAEDDLAHIRWLAGTLADPRAITIDRRPVFLVYRADQLPEPARTTDLWRREVERAGLKGIYLLAVETGWDAGWDATKVGFDAKVLFQPQFSMLGAVDRMDVPNPRLRVYDYQKAWPVLANPGPVSYLRYDCVFPSWDNTPRKGEEGWVVHNSTPEAYQAWLRLAVERALARPADQRVVFVNAWNEWAEGTHLEPDRKDGRAYLEATRGAIMVATHGLQRQPAMGGASASSV
jgi:glycosyltransferase involved in cell wall biosynthesis